ncbi:hypothetical protein SH1V18_36780 [Vallitalea longa]|uniref:Xylose isomerase-like TIM barrel domain-containing protein n=1 Tax=Vallitalea longa TaxID=2936439 RepID=A0A9W5YHC6_9FIRM|nr:sugar phosphate isomerase/epimerase [Vallitalea longa]GKX31198.1 hypothetical protein SH1V18_36780 [Vallitalea longa]
MKLGIIAEPCEQSFIDAKKRQLETLEFCLHPTFGMDKSLKKLQAIKEVKQYIEKYGIDVAAISIWATDKIDEKGNLIKNEIDLDYKLIDVASSIGCTNVVTSCNYIEGLSYYENCSKAIEYFEKLIEYGKPKKVKISTYNCRWNNFVHNDMAWTIIHGYLKDLGIKYDPSHAVYDDGDYLAEMKKWGHRFYHVHLKGAMKINDIRFDDPPIGMDEIDWGRFMAILYANKYEDALCLEPHSENWEGELGEKGIDFSINYIKPYILR